MYKARYRLHNDITQKYTDKQFNEWDELKLIIGAVWDDISLLNFYRSGLTSLPNKAGYWPKKLHTIFLNGNNIAKVPDIYGYWPENTQSITLSFNNLKKIPNNWPPNLKGLYLMGNQIENVCFRIPRKLCVLNLSDNFISELPSDPDFWPQELMYLNVSHNSISEIPKTHVNLPKLIYRDNPIVKL